MPKDKRRIDVMVSSTTSDLGDHRRRLGQIITNLLLTPRMMDNEAPGKDGLSFSLELVDEAEVYVLLLGFRYGYVPDDPVRNPDKLSMTHLEYRRAKQRQKTDGICVLPFLVDDALKPEVVRPELTAFREEVKQDMVKFFRTEDELALLVQQALAQSPCVLNPVPSRRDDRPFEPRVGEVLADLYTFREKLGQGGNGEVWRAEDRLTDGSTMDVAIKLLKPDVSANPRRIDRFLSEIARTRRLRHPNIILTTTDGQIGGQFYAVMDYIKGQTLRDFMTGRRFSDKETTRYLLQVAEALDAAHRQNIVHRDVKPENILVCDDRLYLGDFGLAISPDEDTRQTESGEWVGTKKYMAPEQWDNQPVSPQTDVYALAIIAYEMLTGVFPYDASSHARLLTQHMNDELPSHDGLPEEILRILRRATAKTPAARHSSAVDLVIALEHWLSDPDNLETIISKYLSGLRVRLKGEFYDKLFIDLEGNIRTVIGQVQRETASGPVYDDPMLKEFEALLDGVLVDQDADLHQPDEAEPRPVPNIVEQLLESQRVVLVGEPGSGKTFTLRRLVMLYINEYRKYRRVPVFVPLNAFKGETTFLHYIRDQIADLAPYYEELRTQDRLVLICDALNEMPRTAVTDDARDLVDEVRGELVKVPRFVVSCRVRDYKNDLDSLKLERLEVRDLDLRAIREFVRRYRLIMEYDDGELWAKMGGSDDLFEFWESVRRTWEPERFWQVASRFPVYTSIKANDAWHRMWQGAKLIPLARNPYLARVICSLHSRAAMPEKRAELYAAFVADLYERERDHASRRGQSFPAPDVLEGFLTGLANRMQAEQTTVLKAADVAEDALLEAALNATILTQDGSKLRFTHQLLQEYFAARMLAQKMYADEPLLLDDWWAANVWRETFLMLAEFVDDTPQAIRWLGQTNPELAHLTWLRIAPGSPLDTASQQALIESATEKAKEVNPIGRASAYRVLGTFDGDKRPGIGTVIRAGVELPDIDWVLIPAGEFTYQAGRERLDYDFYIARYPITCLQFHTFLDDQQGYLDADRWFDGLAADDDARQLRKQYFNGWNHPCEAVNWYQAIAFCRWFSWHLGGSYDLDHITDWAVRLPTEFEWEKAARANTGWTYPYGDTFDAWKCNTNEVGIGVTTAVGIFPDGDTPHWSRPIADLSGNVWEWCLTDYRTPTRDPVSENLRSPARRVLRGGSCLDVSDLARAAFRVSDVSSDRDGKVGFRVCRPPSL